MSVFKCSNNKFKIGGSGKCMYRSRAKAMAAYRAYLAKHPEADADEVLLNGIPDEPDEEEETEKMNDRARRNWLKSMIRTRFSKMKS